MHWPSILSLLGASSVFDEMLRLIGIAAIVHAFFKGVKSLMAKPAVVPTPAPVVATPPPPAAQEAAPEVFDDAIAPEIVAIIAAAVASVTDSAHRIVSIKRQSSTWERAGRQSVLTSHRIR
ncbi:MAG: hypothetical protein RLZZ214_2299 [Verrucomicrobiota bacterium]|jgi:hypothetical protein